MQNLVAYLWILWNEWRSGMTGGILAVALTIWGAVPRTVIGAAAIGYLVFASYAAWLKERKRADEAESKSEATRPSEQAMAFVRAEILRLAAAEKLLVAHLVIGGSIRKVDAMRNFKVEPASQLLKWEDGACRIDPAYLEAVKQYFKENPA
jgi:hypothetical protein